MCITFLERVTNHFKYLVADYGFSIKRLKRLRSLEAEGRVELENGITFVTLSAEQWSVGTTLGLAQDNK